MVFYPPGACDILSRRGLIAPGGDATIHRVRVISLRPLREFWLRHPDARTPLRLWHKTATHAVWRNIRDVRASYPSADGVRDRGGGVLTVFNICGNKYRLIARIRYDYQLINVRAVLTHEEYDRGNWKE